MVIVSIKYYILVNIVLSIEIQYYFRRRIAMIGSIQLKKDSDRHLYIQLYSQLRGLIESGDLEVESKLPPIRKFAKRLDVNNVTIVNAYKLLEEEELIYKKVGSGTFVAPRQSRVIEQIELDEEIYIDEDSKFINEFKSTKVINFATAAPTPDLFPIEPFQRLLNKVLERDRGYAFGYQKSQGYLPLRQSLAEYISNYNIDAIAEEIQIVSGAQQGIDILAKTFLDYGDTVFVERPSYPGAISVFQSRKANIIEIPMRSNGIDIDLLEERLQQFNPKILYLMPNFQNPTGWSYVKEKKEKVLELAEEYDFLIIEDDCLSNLNYGEKDNISLKSLDKNDRVIYIKSFSKIFMPGLRLAFLIIPEAYFDQILLSKYMSDIFTDGLVQRVLDLYFKEEIWEEQLYKLRRTYQRRYESMKKALKRELPQEVKVIFPEGGLNLWLQLPENISAKKIQEKALEYNLNIAPGEVFYHQHPEKNTIRLSIAATDNREIEKGVKLLAKILKEEISKERYQWDNSIMPLV